MKKGIVFLVILLLAGCAGHMQNKQYYQLQCSYDLSTMLHVPKNGNIIRVAPVILNGYLDQEGIIYQTAPFEYVAATNHLWISSLSGQLQNILVTRLSKLLPDQLVTTIPVESPKLTIQTVIDNFNGTYEHDVIIKGHFLITKKDGSIIQHNFYHRIAQPAEGYQSLVQTLSAGFESEIKDLVRKAKL